MASPHDPLEHDLNPYSGGAGVHRVSPGLLEQASQAGLRIVDELDSGNAESLPDGVLAWLGKHTLAVSAPLLAEQRLAVADYVAQQTSPYRLATTKAVAALVRGVIDQGNTFATNFLLTDQMLASRMDDLFRGEPF